VSDIVHELAWNALARRGLLFEQFIVAHIKCAGVPGIPVRSEQENVETGNVTQRMKCVCGASLEVSIAIALEVRI